VPAEDLTARARIGLPKERTTTGRERRRRERPGEGLEEQRYRTYSFFVGVFVGLFLPRRRPDDRLPDADGC
jgi:hypothetical protein